MIHYGGNGSSVSQDIESEQSEIELMGLQTTSEENILGNDGS